jgi:hypothetical protein
MYCIYVFLLHRESSDIILKDKSLISMWVMSHEETKTVVSYRDTDIGIRQDTPIRSCSCPRIVPAAGHGEFLQSNDVFCNFGTINSAPRSCFARHSLVGI